MTSSDVAELLGVELRTVHKWVRQGRLPAINMGGRTGYRISESALEQFVLARRVTSTATAELAGKNER